MNKPNVRTKVFGFNKEPFWFTFRESFRMAKEQIWPSEKRKRPQVWVRLKNPKVFFGIAWMMWRSCWFICRGQHKVILLALLLSSCTPLLLAGSAVSGLNTVVSHNRLGKMEKRLTKLEIPRRSTWSWPCNTQPGGCQK